MTTVDDNPFNYQEFLVDALSRARSDEMDVGNLIETAERLSSKSNHDDIVKLYYIWILFHENHPNIHAIKFNYGVALYQSGNVPDAIKTLQDVMREDKNFYPAYINGGTYLEAAGQTESAVAIWQQLTAELSSVTKATIDFKLMALKQIARVHRANNKHEEAEAAILQALSIKEEQPEIVEQLVGIRQAQCHWPLFGDFSASSRKNYLNMIAPLTAATYVDDPLFHLANAHRYNRDRMGWPKEYFGPAQWPKPSDKLTRLKIGYVSSDFRDHAVGFSMTEVLELHNRENVEIFGYYCGSVKSTDKTQIRIKNAVDHWIDISELDDEAVCQKIIADGIHILIDLNGYSKDARTTVFAKKPAPIIVNWFGYPGTMGSPYHHYILADDTIIPAELEQYYSEKVVKLACYQPNDRKRTVSTRIPSRAEIGLPDDVTVFCCLNGLQKLNRPTFELWMRILKNVPDSVLWILSGTAKTNERLLAFAKDRGISPERIIFATPLANPDHVARYQLADLFLDNMPYGAHTTAADSLWMGVPIVTMTGKSFAARVCSSLLRAAGLEETICGTIAEYEAKAISLGNDKSKPAELKTLLKNNRDSCVLFDTTKLVRDLENAYKMMWNDYLTDNLPVPDLENLELYQDIATDMDYDLIGLLNFDDIFENYQNSVVKNDRYLMKTTKFRFSGTGKS